MQSSHQAPSLCSTFPAVCPPCSFHFAVPLRAPPGASSGAHILTASSQQEPWNPPAPKFPTAVKIPYLLCKMLVFTSTKLEIHPSINEQRGSGMSLELELHNFQQYCHQSKGMISIQRWKSHFFSTWLCWLPPLGLISLISYKILFLSF